METFRELGKRLSNWGRWGPDDERGTLNFFTSESMLKASRCVRSGKVFELSIPLDENGPQIGRNGRHNPIHRMSILPGDRIETLDGVAQDDIVGSDDLVILPLQSATQWDSLAHVGYDDLLYNGVSASRTVRANLGATRNSIDKTMPGVVGRGVLLDIARMRGVDWIKIDDDPVSADELENAVVTQGTEVGPGDALLVRTGWRKKSLVEGWTEEWITTNPGLDLDCAEWLYSREVACVAVDNWCVEVQPSRTPDCRLPLHCVLIRDMGLQLGEMFDLEALAEDCTADGQWDFLLSAPPLRITNAVGSPTSPIAIK